MTNILQLKITLNGSRPQIWRRFIVQDTISFHKLHKIIQVVMGWDSRSLYDFDVKGLCISIPDPEYLDNDIVNSNAIKLAALLGSENQKFEYTYDLRDCWAHTIILEKITAVDKRCAQNYPLCIAGERACPLEACRTIEQYENDLKMRKKKYPSLDDDFNIEDVNELLAHTG